MGAFQELNVAVGEALAPIARIALQAFRGASFAAREFVQANPQIIRVISLTSIAFAGAVGVAATFGAAMVALGLSVRALGASIGILTAPLRLLVVPFQAAAVAIGGLLVATRLILVPIRLLGSAIAALATLAQPMIALSVSFAQLGASFARLFAGVIVGGALRLTGIIFSMARAFRVAVSVGIPFLRFWAGTTRLAFSSLYAMRAFLRTLSVVVTRGLAALVTGLIPLATSTLAGLATLSATLFSGLLGAIGAVVGGLIGLIPLVATAVASVTAFAITGRLIDNVIRRIPAIASDAFAFLVSGFRFATENAKQFFGTIAEAGRSAFASVPAQSNRLWRGFKGH